MKPYYEDSSTTIYHGDCQELVCDLGRLQLVVTDPPYGMDYQSARRTEWQRKDKIQGDQSAYPKWMFNHMPLIAMFLFCRWSNLKELPEPKSFIVWDKCRHSMGDLEHEFGRQWEAIAFYAGPLHKFTYRPIDIIRAPCVPPAKLVHPNEKPVECITPLLACHDARHVIVDPYMGSGTTLVAAKAMGRKSIGIDIDEKYCEIAANRVGQGVINLV